MIGRNYGRKQSEISDLLSRPELEKIGSRRIGDLRVTEEDLDREGDESFEQPEEKRYHQITVILALLEIAKVSVYLVDEVGTGYDMVSAVRLADCFEKLEKESLVIYLSSSSHSIDYTKNHSPRKPLGLPDLWFELVKGCRQYLKTRGKSSDGKDS